MSKFSFFRGFRYALIGGALLYSQAQAEVPVDTMPNVATLPAQYPDSWIYVREFLDPIVDGYSVIDVADEQDPYKGFIQAGYISSILVPRTRPEVLVATTVRERTGTGKRTDFLAFTNKQNLKTDREIILPEDKRAIVAAGLTRMQLSADEKFVFIFNFTPATSVTVVDLDRRQIVGEVDIPGCTLIYPTGRRSFTSLCGDGSMTTFVLDAAGHVTHENRLEQINDFEHDSLYSEPARIGKIFYFSTLGGNVQPIDMSIDAPKALSKWALISPEDKAAGWVTGIGEYNTSDLAADDQNRLYVRVRQTADAAKGRAETTEVWVYDVANKKRVARIPLVHGGSTIAVTHGRPYLVVTPDPDPVIGAGLDVYDGISGKLLRQIAGWRQGSTLALSAVHD